MVDEGLSSPLQFPTRIQYDDGFTPAVLSTCGSEGRLGPATMSECGGGYDITSDDLNLVSFLRFALHRITDSILHSSPSRDGPHTSGGRCIGNSYIPLQQRRIGDVHDPNLRSKPTLLFVYSICRLFVDYCPGQYWTVLEYCTSNCLSSDFPLPLNPCPPPFFPLAVRVADGARCSCF